MARSGRSRRGRTNERAGILRRSDAGFQDQAEVADVLLLLDARSEALPGEPVSLAVLAGRVLAEGVVSSVDVPGFARAAMDGYRSRPRTRSGRTRTTRCRWKWSARRCRPGRSPARSAGSRRRVMTGAAVPAEADAVLPAEAAGERDGRVLVREPVSPGRHVGRVGEDVAKGREILAAGRWLRPQDVGLLASIGVGSAGVVRRPRVAVLVTGNELLPPGSVPKATGSRTTTRRCWRRWSPATAASACRCATWRIATRRYGTRSPGPTPTWCWCPAGLRSAGKTMLRGSSPNWANWRSGVALRPASPTGVGFLSPSPAGERG